MTSNQPAKGAKRQRSSLTESSGSRDLASAAVGTSESTPKVAIPRLHSSGTDSGGPRRRTKHACVACQTNKVKCSGETPSCRRCSEMQLICLYGLDKRATNRGVQERLEGQNSQAHTLLLELRSRSDGEARRMIEDYLNNWADTNTPNPSTTQPTDATRQRSPPQETVESNAPASEIGSQGSPDVMDEDFDENDVVRATGYHGKSSDIHWWRRANDQEPADSTMAESGKSSPEGSGAYRPLSVANYHLDDMEISSTSTVDAHEMPSPEVAHRLIQLYNESTQGEFPCVDGRWLAFLLEGALQESLHRSEALANPRQSADLNMIFAIGASYAHLTGDAQGDERDHLLYFARARMLATARDPFVHHPDVQDVRLRALMGFYYLCSSQLNRSWIVSGYAVRAAFALGLHVRDESTNISPADKEARMLLWWALWLLERQLVALTGRPTAIQESSCSVPRPGDGQNPPRTFTSQYLNLRIDLAKLSQRIVDHLYAPSVVLQDWSSVQATMLMLESALLQWRSQLPHAYDFGGKRGNDLANGNRATRTLGFHFYMNVMLTTRPCLCDPRRMGRLSEEIMAATRKRAEDCITAAKKTIELLSDSFDAVDLYQYGPWYNQVSIVMQACSVIMLVLSLRTVQLMIQSLLPTVERMIAWLREMARHNAEAYRGWHQCISTLEALASRTDLDLSNINTSVPTWDSDTKGRKHSVFPTTASIMKADPGSNKGDAGHSEHLPPTPIGQFLQELDLQEDESFLGQGYPFSAIVDDMWSGLDFSGGESGPWVE